MISSFRNFAKTKFAGLLVFIMIIPFVFWGMGSMFNSGNTNNIAKINKTNISTQEFIDYLNRSGIPQETIRKNLDSNIIEELLSGLVSKTLLDLEVKDFDILFSEKTLLKKIKKNKKYFFSMKDVILVESLKSDGIKVPERYKDLYELDDSEIPSDIKTLIKDEDMGVAMLRIVEFIGQDRLIDIDADTMYLIISTLNQLNVDPIRNKILFKVLPLKV